MMTREQLKMSAEEYDALIKVRDALNNGTLVHVEADHFDDTKHKGFDMSVGCRCGTIACIGGWMALFMGKDKRQASVYVDNFSWSFVENRAHEPLRNLFYPDTVRSGLWHSITPYEAISAINNFLEHGNPRWNECVKEDEDEDEDE